MDEAKFSRILTDVVDHVRPSATLEERVIRDSRRRRAITSLMSVSAMAVVIGVVSAISLQLPAVLRGAPDSAARLQAASGGDSSAGGIQDGAPWQVVLQEATSCVEFEFGDQDKETSGRACFELSSDNPLESGRAWSNRVEGDLIYGVADRKVDALEFESATGAGFDVILSSDASGTRVFGFWVSRAEMGELIARDEGGKVVARRSLMRSWDTGRQES
jgi:hypothetical protein